MTRKRNRTHFIPPTQLTATPSQTLNRNLNIKAEISSSWSGPFPPPEILAKYNDALPDGANRIVAMAETQSQHRQYIEKWVVIGDFTRALLGVIFAFLLGIYCVYKGASLILGGYQWPGGLLGSGGVIALATAFIYGTKARRQERLQKNNQNLELIGAKKTNR